MEDISGFGLILRVRASMTFPAGFNVTQFADDADPFDAPSIQVRDKAMGVNGDLIVWSRANPLLLSVSVIPGTADDRNLSILLDANRVSRGKMGARDVITLVGIYPGLPGRAITCSMGTITDGPPLQSVASSGRKKSNTYQFAFENVVRT